MSFRPLFSTSVFSLCLVGGIVVACGGRPASSSTPAAASSSPGTSKDQAPTKTSADGKTMDDHHHEFVDNCTKRRGGKSSDYCECAWDELKKVVPEEDMSDNTPLPAETVAKYKKALVGTCTAKIPEEDVKKNWDQGCVGETPEMKAYCDCSWTEYRKRFSPAELSDEEVAKSESFLSARGPVVKACGSKVSEAVVKSAFVKGCVKEPKLEKFCGCAWKAVRKIASAAEVNAGMTDETKMRDAVEKDCKKLLPQ